MSLRKPSKGEKGASRGKGGSPTPEGGRAAASPYARPATSTGIPAVQTTMEIDLSTTLVLHLGISPSYHGPEVCAIYLFFCIYIYLPLSHSRILGLGIYLFATSAILGY